MLEPFEIAALTTSLKVAGLAVAWTLPLALMAAFALARGRFAGRSVLDALVHLPLVLPPVVVGYGLLILFGAQGPLGGLLDHAFGWRLVFTTEGAALAAGIVAFPLMVRAIRLALDAVDPKIEEAATTLGAGGLDRFVSVTLPLIAPGILAAIIIAFAASLGEFGAVITFAANVPGETQTLPLAIYSAIQMPDGEARAARLAAIAVAVAVAALIASEALTRWTRERVRA